MCLSPECCQLEQKDKRQWVTSCGKGNASWTRERVLLCEDGCAPKQDAWRGIGISLITFAWGSPQSAAWEMFQSSLCFGQKGEERMSQSPFLSKSLHESVDGLLPAFLGWADWQKCLWLLCSWATTNNSGFHPCAVHSSSTLAIFEALNSCPLSLQYLVLLGGDVSAHLTASVPHSMISAW